MPSPVYRSYRTAQPYGAGPEVCSDMPDDATLLGRIALQDEAAFTLLYARYAPRLRRFLARYLRQQELAEEVCHDALLAVWEQAGRFEPGLQVAPWLFGIARHKALSALRQVGVRTLPLAAAPEESSASPETQIYQQECARIVRQTLDTLSPVQQAVLTLAYYHGYSCRAIATRLECPVGTVKTRLLQARQRLQTLLREQDVGPQTGADSTPKRRRLAHQFYSLRAS